MITGGSRGLGLLLARQFAAEGCRVAICARGAAGLQRALADLQSRGAQALALQCDVAVKDQVDRTMNEVIRQWGRVDILVNNAGVITVGPLHAMKISDFEHSMNVMFWGTLWPILSALPGMMARRSGRIVNVTSIGGKIGVPHLVPYCCAKFAAVGLSQSLGAELARDGIAVTTVAPGLMRTGSHLNAFFKADQDAEYTWFGISAALPGLSISADRAARQIVRATQRRARELTLGAPAQLATRVERLFPELTAALLAWVNEVILPSARGNGSAQRGLLVQAGLPGLPRRVLQALEHFTHPAARNQLQAAG
jgi:NAD(P)-dependent dehydrogenase (short-subunit alcohol dehydrogenase family)